MANLTTPCTQCADSTCYDCTLPCNSSQAFCNIGAQFPINFQFSGSLSAGSQIQITQEDFNNAIEEINTVFTKGSHYTLPRQTLVNDKPYLTAKLFNDTIDIISKRVTDGVPDKVYTGQLIKGTYFSNLQNAINNVGYHPNQCSSCNTDCEGCNSCLGCDTMECFKCVAGETYCCSCVTGETPTPSPST